MSHAPSPFPLSSYAIPDMVQVLVHLFLELLVQLLRLGHQLLEVPVRLLQRLPVVLAQFVVQLDAKVLLCLLRQLLVVLLQYLLFASQVVVQDDLLLQVVKHLPAYCISLLYLVGKSCVPGLEFIQ